MTVKCTFSISTIFSGGVVSDIVVKPRISENRTVSSTLVPALAFWYSL